LRFIPKENTDVLVMQAPECFAIPDTICKPKLAYMAAVLEAYADYLKKLLRGATMYRIKSIDLDDIIANGYARILASYTRIVMLDTYDKTLQAHLVSQLGGRLHVLENPDMFLASRTWLGTHYSDADKGKKRAMSMRPFFEHVKRDLLGGALLGIANTDVENRSGWPRSQNKNNNKKPEVPNTVSPRKTTTPAEKRAIAWVERRFPDRHGDARAILAFPTTFSAARHALDKFVRERLALFGRWQDAVAKDEVFLFHAAISPALNYGLLPPRVAINAALQALADGRAPMQSVEAFVRQVAGWREYMRASYELHSDSMLALGKQSAVRSRHVRDLDWKAWMDGTTGIVPLDTEIKKTVQTGYAHHIVRLMFHLDAMLLARIQPTDIYAWMLSVYIDATPCLMIPNIYAMGYFDTRFTRKRYLCSSAYWLRMSDYPRGAWCKVLDKLYHEQVKRA
jgi:deoxyribodipyrimidine photolyase-related protein